MSWAAAVPNSKVMAAEWGSAHRDGDSPVASEGDAAGQLREYTREQNELQAAQQQAARDAASLIEKIGTTLPDFESKVWVAKRVRGIDMKQISDLVLGIDQQRFVIDDARKDLDAGSFAAARAKAMAVQDWLSQGEEKITEQTRIARSR